MNRFSGLYLGLTIGMFILIPMLVSAFDSPPTSGEGVSEATGVYCEINEVKLFAKSAEDCAKAGGTVTHTVTTTVEPAEKASDNPE